MTTPNRSSDRAPGETLRDLPARWVTEDRARERFEAALRELDLVDRRIALRLSM